jgi:hypothetical protein
MVGDPVDPRDQHNGFFARKIEVDIEDRLLSAHGSDGLEGIDLEGVFAVAICRTDDASQP